MPSVLLEVCCADVGMCAYFKCISALLVLSVSGKVWRSNGCHLNIFHLILVKPETPLLKTLM